jgi:hypothetical protein
VNCSVCYSRLWPTDGDVSGNGVGSGSSKCSQTKSAMRFQHGDSTRPVNLSARGVEDGVAFQVHNYGDPIAPRSFHVVMGGLTSDLPRAGLIADAPSVPFH